MKEEFKLSNTEIVGKYLSTIEERSCYKTGKASVVYQMSYLQSVLTHLATFNTEVRSYLERDMETLQRLINEDAGKYLSNV